MKAFRDLLAVGVAALILSSGAASALGVKSCASKNPDVSGMVSPSSGCMLIRGAVVKRKDINDGGALDNAFGGNREWMQVDKVKHGDGAGKYLDVDKKAGSWAISSAAASTYDRFAMLFKAKKNRNTGFSKQIVYLLDGTEGTFGNPLLRNRTCTDESTDSCKAKKLRHVRLLAWNAPVVAQRPVDDAPVSPVPLPAAGWLLVGAFGGLFAFRKAKKA